MRLERLLAAALCACLSHGALAADSTDAATYAAIQRLDRELQQQALALDAGDESAVAGLARARSVAHELVAATAPLPLLARKAAHVRTLAESLAQRAALPATRRAELPAAAVVPPAERLAVAAASATARDCAAALQLQPDRPVRIALEAGEAVWVRLSLPPGQAPGITTRGSSIDSEISLYADCRDTRAAPLAASDDNYGLQAELAVPGDTRRGTWVAHIANLGVAGDLVVRGGGARTVSGRVLRALDSGVVSNLTVAAFRDFGGFYSYSGSAATDLDGNYSLFLFDNGDGPYLARTGESWPIVPDLVMSAYGGAACRNRDWFYIESCTGTLTPITVPAGSGVSGIDFALISGATIAGRVRSARDGSAVSAASISVYDVTGAALAITATDAAGRYRLRGLAPGSYFVSAQAAEYEAELHANVPCSIFGCLPTSGTPIPLSPGASAAIDFELAPQLFIPVTTTLDGEPVALGFGGSVQVLNSNGLVLAQASPGTSVRLGPLPPGSYFLRALPYDWAPRFSPQLYAGVSCASDCLGELAFATPITLSAAQAPVPVLLDLQSLPRLSGRVSDTASGEGIALATVRLLRPGFGEQAVATSAPDGSYEFAAVPAGSYFLMFEALEHLDEIHDNVPCESATPLVDCLGGVLLTVTADSADLQIDASLQKAASATGRITSGSSGLLYLPVSAFSPGNVALPGTTTLDLGSGNYRLVDIRAGSYAFGAGSYGYWSQLYPALDCSDWTGYFSGCNFAAATRLSFAAGQQRTGIDFDLRPNGSRRGRVLDAATQQPLPGIAIDLWTAAGAHVASAVSGPDGKFIAHAPYTSGPHYVSTDSGGSHRDQVYNGATCAVGSVYLGTCDIQIGQSIVLPATSPDAPDLVFTLLRAGVLFGNGFE